MATFWELLYKPQKKETWGMWNINLNTYIYLFIIFWEFTNKNIG